MSERRIPYACRSVMLYLYIIGQQLMSLVVLLLYPAQRSWGGGYGVALDVRASSYHTHTHPLGGVHVPFGVLELLTYFFTYIILLAKIAEKSILLISSE